MKKVISVLICLAMALTLFGCSKSNDADKGTDAGEKSVSQNIEMVLTPGEYVLYQNIFYNGQANDYVNKETTKHGIFTVLYDEYSSVTRYYVWGYNDNTKCCDWQWEIVPSDTDKLPNEGSAVDVTGTFVQSENALDGYWIENATITVTSEYKGSAADVDMTTMDGTLERVQIANMQAHPDKFEGKTVIVYGRIDGPSSVQHPYYDNCFSQEFVSDDTVLATGTNAVISGTYTNGVISGAKVETTNSF